MDEAALIQHYLDNPENTKKWAIRNVGRGGEGYSKDAECQLDLFVYIVFRVLSKEQPKPKPNNNI